MVRKPLPVLGDIYRDSPTRSPDWRWLCANEYHQAQRIAQIEEDEDVRWVVRYFRSYDAAPLLEEKASVQRRYGTLTTALRLYDAPGSQAWELQARLLTNQTTGEVALAGGLDPQVVDSYCRIFFEVRRGGQICDLDWLVPCIFSGFQPSARPPESVVWMYSALAGGVPLLNLMMGDFLGLPEPQHLNRHEIAELVRLLTRQHAADLAGEQELSAQLLLKGKEMIRDRIDLISEANRLLPDQVDILRTAGNHPPTAYRQGTRRPPELASTMSPTQESAVVGEVVPTTATTL